MNTVKLATEVAYDAHGKQMRRGAQEAYVRHSERVSVMVRELGGCSDMVAAALLHDAIEDTELKMIDLVGKFSDRTVRLVSLLTKTEDNKGYYLDNIKKNEDAILIKFCDALDNSNVVWDAWHSSNDLYNEASTKYRRLAEELFMLLPRNKDLDQRMTAIRAQWQKNSKDSYKAILNGTVMESNPDLIFRIFIGLN